MAMRRRGPYTLFGFEDPFDDLFGVTEEDMFPQLVPRVAVRPMQRSGRAKVEADENEFRVFVDVSHFSPEEINVKTVENNVIIHCKHEEKQDEHGFIKREFTRQYMLPEGVDPNTVKSTMSENGILTIRAPRPALEAPKEKVIPIEFEKGSQKPVMGK